MGMQRVFNATFECEPGTLLVKAMKDLAGQSDTFPVEWLDKVKDLCPQQDCTAGSFNAYQSRAGDVCTKPEVLRAVWWKFFDANPAFRGLGELLTEKRNTYSFRIRSSR